MLIRWHNGESKVWSVVRAPSAEDEDARQMHRELIALRGERTAHVNAIKGMLAGLGLVAGVDERLPGRLAAMRQWDGKPIPQGVLQRILREHERWRLVGRQIAELEAQRRAKIRDDATPHVEKVRRAAGAQGDRGERGVAAGGGAVRVASDQEPPRAGEPRGPGADAVCQRREPPRAGDQQGGQPPGPLDDGAAGMVLVEVSARQCAEPMVRMARFAGGNARSRKVGIVALSRKLLVALWKYVERGEVPEGAEVVGWEKKVPKEGEKGRARRQGGRRGRRREGMGSIQLHNIT